MPRQAILDAFEAALDAVATDEAVRSVLVTGPSGELDVNWPIARHVRASRQLRLGRQLSR